MKELLEANLQPNQLIELESEMQLLENAESIKTNLHQAFVALSENDDALISQFNNIAHLLQNIKQHKPELAALHQRMQSTILEMKDMADELETIQQSISTDAERMQIVSDRLDLLNKLLKKHHAANEEELLQIQHDFQQKIKNIEVGNDDIDLLQKEISVLHQQLHKSAKSLSSNRLKAATIFEKEVNKLLVQVGMPHALLKIEHHLLEEINASGLDNFKFLFTANKGSSLQEISKVASGGELSRLMLCIK